MTRRLFWTAAFLLAGAGAQADNIATGFEFDAVAPFQAGNPPLTATFTGGAAAVPDDPALRLGGTRAWLIEEGTLGVMTLDVPARGVYLQSRTEFAAGGEVRVYNVNGVAVLTRPITSSFSVAQIVVGNNPAIERVEFDGFAGAGVTAVDDIIWIADTTPTDITILYTRPDNDYANVIVNVTGGVAGGGPLNLNCAPTTSNAFGCEVQFEIDIGGDFAYTVLKDGVADNATPIAIDSDQLEATDKIYTFSGSQLPFIGTLPAVPFDDVTVPGPDEVIVHYIRPDGNYTGWGLHLFEAGGQDWTNFTGGEHFPEVISPELGAVYRVALPQNTSPPYSAGPAPVNPFPDSLGLIIHNGPTKDPGPDQFIRINDDGNMLFVLSGINQIFTAPPDPNAIQITGASAHWLTTDTLVWDPLGSPAAVELHYSADGSISVSGTQLVGQDEIYPLTAGAVNPSLPNALHLSTFPAWSLPPAAVNNAATLAKGQLLAVALNGNGDQIQATAVQFPFLLDALYASAAENEPLGVNYSGGVPTLSVWAPTAKSVTLNIFDLPDDAAPSSSLPMTYDPATGIWSLTGDASWDRRWYTYTVNVYVPEAGAVLDNEVTDPYSANLSAGSSPNRLTKTQILNLGDSDLKPAGWDTLQKPALAAPEDIVVYELQVRDFSAFDLTVAAADRGKYTAFNQPASDGRQHLEALAAAGMTHLHLLPTFDIATVNETRAERVELEDPVEDLCAANPDAASLCITFAGMTILEVMESQPGDGSLQQQITEWLRGLDGFNWGYDPYHFNAPEGSYSTDPDGTARVLEFREMVQALADSGLRTVMDVVYNHTNASGSIASTSVLDKVVPGYYQRRNQSSGIVLGDSCCQDTATEHAMMEKLMVDTLVNWAREYKIDGFRFDLMGFHTLANMEKVRDTLQSLNAVNDGVDGASIYLYGEGWNFGDIASDRRFVQATQANLIGTGIGSFNDRLRDGVRGGGPFDSGVSHISNQGFASGLYYDPNAQNSGGPTELNTLLTRSDWIRIGMTGNLASYVLETASGALQTGAQINYNGQPAGYTADPQETINYIGKHDNETLWDISKYKHPVDTPQAERVRAHAVASSVVLLGQGVPFIHAGQELLRSKSMDRDSFDSGDWYNRLDFTLSDNNFAVGEPRNSTNSGSLTQIRAVLTIAEADAQPQSIQASFDAHTELLAIRRSSQLFRLPTAAQISQRVSFHNTGPNQVPGMIVQRLDGCTSPALQPETGTLVTVINARDESVSLPLFQSEDFALHPVLAASADPVVRTASHNTQGFSVPARTTAVFVAANQFACVDGDSDADGFADDADNCIWNPNASQLDSDADGIGNACDADLDNSCSVNPVDLGLFRSAFFSTPGAPNWNPAADFNGDGVVNPVDLGRMRARFFQDYSTANPSGVANICSP